MSPHQNSGDSPIEVVVGVVVNKVGDVLVNQRTYPVEFAGKWEFPGGKVEANETIEQALRRELMEEINIDTIISEPLISITHQYPHSKVRLHVRKVTDYQGTPEGKEGQTIQWIAVDDLRDINFLEANEPILNAVVLPHYYLITNTAEFGCTYTLQRLESLLAKQNCFVQVREKDMEFGTFAKFAERVTTLCHRHGAIALANTDPQIAIDLGFDGVHLTSAKLKALDTRPGVRGFWVAASCHNRTEVEAAQRLELDFAVLSPVAQTKSHPMESALGWEQFSTCCSASNIPIYALGGMGFGDAVMAREQGAQGVAMIRAAWET